MQTSDYSIFRESVRGIWQGLSWALFPFFWWALMPAKCGRWRAGVPWFMEGFIAAVNALCDCGMLVFATSILIFLADFSYALKLALVHLILLAFFVLVWFAGLIASTLVTARA